MSGSGTASSGSRTSGARTLGDLERAQLQVVALEQLLEVHEQTSLEQATRLEQAVREREELLSRERAWSEQLVEAGAARDHALAAAQAERQRLFEIFMQAPAAITLLEGAEHVFTVVNPLYKELIGGRDVRGKTVRQGLPELEGQGFYELLDRVYETGEPYAAREMLVRLRRDETGEFHDVHVDFVYQPLTDSAGSVFGIMAHAVDVTSKVQARRQIEDKAEELSRLTRDLEQSNRELDQFAYVASHDLKAPLRGIANLITWIEEDIGDRITGESREHMQLLKGRVTRMEGLIEGVLAYSRAGRVREGIETVDVGALIAETVELLAPPATMTISIAPGMPTIQSERTPLQQVFINLVGNAIKYSGRDDAHIDIRVQPDGEHCHRYTVADDGVGIAPQYHEKVWEIFQVLAPRDKVEGTGIGLSVVRKLVETRGGRAWLESHPGLGTTFHFTWPRRPRILP